MSLTGGLLPLSKPLVPEILIEVIFRSNGGPDIGLAELLIPASATLKCLQLFKFIMIDDDDCQRLSSLILSWVAEFVAAGYECARIRGISEVNRSAYARSKRASRKPGAKTWPDITSVTQCC
jgi:hypothetical protein